MKNNIKQTYTGLPDKNFFCQLSGEQLNNLKDYEIKEVAKDANCGYRALSLQIYNDENNYNIIRTHAYTVLNTNLDFYKDKHNEAIKEEDYIPYIKNDGFWMEVLEFSIINIIYDINLFIFEKNINIDTINLLKIYVNIADKSKNILNICFVNDNHFIFDMKKIG